MTSFPLPTNWRRPRRTVVQSRWQRPIGAIGLAPAGLVGGCGQAHAPTPPASTVTARASLPPSATGSSRGQAVAAGFYRAWGSYDAIHDRPETFASRCRPLVTPRLARELVDDRPASADWMAKRKRREVSVIRVAALRQPDGAPVPTPQRMYVRVYADRITANRDGRAVTPTGATLVVVRQGRRWLVDRVLSV